jgi:tetratricopeptide (TPR) repeat protein
MMKTTHSILSHTARRLGWLPALLLALCPAWAAAQLSKTLWNNPVFQKRLQGSFGFSSEVEPSLSENELADYEQIRPLLQEEPERALEYLAKLAYLPGSSARFDFLAANLHFQADRKPQAMQFFLRALDKFPDYRQAHNNLAILFVQAGRPLDAIRHFTEAIRLGAVDGTTYGLLGLAYISTENFVAAEECFRNAIVLNPEVKDWEMGLIQAMYSQEKFSEVITTMNRMIKLAPEDDKLWMLQANAYLGRKESLAAAANFEIVDQMGKLPAAGLNTLADIYVNEGLLAVAAAAYLRAFEKDEAGGVSGPLRAAEILLAREGYDAALELLEKVRQARGDSLTRADEIQVLKLEAKIGMADGREDAAAETLRTVVQKDPLDGDALILLGQYHQRQGELEKAANFFETAAGIRDFEMDASVRLAQLKVGQGKYEEAIPLLKRAQDIQPRESVGRFLEDLERFLKTRR